MPQPGSPASGKKSNHRWLLYAAGAGALLALIVLLSKNKAASSSSSEGEVLAPANVPEGTGSAGGAGPQLGSELDAFRAELPGAVAEGNQTLAAEQAAGFTGIEQALANVEGQLEKGYKSPTEVRTAEEAAYHRGVAVIKAQDKTKAAATHKTPGRPAKRPTAHHTAPKPHKKTTPHAPVKHPAVKRAPTRRPTHTAPKPHHTKHKTKRR